MTHVLRVAAFALLGCATAASAQNWNGSYYGASVGLGSGDYALGVPSLDEDGETVAVTGLLYGIHGGVHFQQGSMVFGGDAAIFLGPEGTTSAAALDPDGARWQCVSGACNVAIDTLTTLRAKVGIITDIRTLVYGAGGLAIATVDGGIRNSQQQGQSTATGLTYAIGVERITSPFSTIFAEAGYYDLGELTFGTNAGDDEPPPTVADFTGTGDFYAIRVGVNYKF